MPRLRMTPEEYLAYERASEEKHEYADGEVFARSGCTYEHSIITGNVLGELGVALLERPCAVHGSNMRVKIAATNCFFYPDASVICGRPVFADDKRDCVLNPKLVVEVLSDSTERYDRGDKFEHYRKIDALQDYVLVSQTKPLVEHYSRRLDGTWLYRAIGPGEQLVLGSLDCEIAVDRIYLKVDFPPGDVP